MKSGEIFGEMKYVLKIKGGEPKTIDEMVHGPFGLDKPTTPCTENFKCSKSFLKPIVPKIFIDEKRLCAV